MRWYRLILGAAVLLGALTGLVDNGTVAYFKSSATSTANAFSAGSVDIANSPSSALLTVSGMVPGEKIYAALTVTNSGSLPLRYALASTVTNSDSKGLGAQLALSIAASASASCTSTSWDGGTAGTVVYGAALPLGTLGASRDLIGTPTAFPNSGRTLNAGTSESLCFQVSLPSATSNAFQGASTTATFSFSAQQL